MSARNLIERTRVYLANYAGSKESHSKGKKIVSLISGPLPVFFIICNYFNFLEEGDKYSWKGIVFFFLSIVYGLYCFWLYLEKLWKS